MKQKIKKELKDINLWEMTGKMVTTFALAGAALGPLTHTAINYSLAAVNDQPAKEIKAADLAYTSLRSTENMSLSGLFTAGVLCLVVRRQRSQAAKKQGEQGPLVQPQ